MDVKQHWDNQASLGELAGTKDLIIKKIEMQAIGKYAKDGMKILDFGCGNGLTALEIARTKNVEILGMDFSEQMIIEAERLEPNVRKIGRVSFKVGDTETLKTMTERFDMIYTERMIINLPTWEIQKEVIRNILALLKDDGIFVMCENSQNGVDALNEIRGKIDKYLWAHPLKAPWHNRYLRDDEMGVFKTTISEADYTFVREEYYSSTYYLLSRVVNAALAFDAGVEPDYNAEINQMALKLPALKLNIGQGKIWVWQRTPYDEWKTKDGGSLCIEKVA